MPALRLAFVFAACLPLATPVRARDKSAVDVGLRKQLVVDDFVVAKMTGVRRELGVAVKANAGRPIFTDGRFYGTVLHDEGKFKMWHRKHDNSGYAYAESADGITFSPRAAVRGIHFAGDVNLAVEIDPHDTDPLRRFKAGYDAPGMAAGLAYSADGISWTPYNEGRPVTYRAADCHNQVVWDELAQTYRLFTRTDFGLGGGPRAGTVAKDFEVRGTRGMVNADLDARPADWHVVREWHFDREGPREYRRRQIYSMTCWIYEGVYFGLLSVYEHPGDVREGKATDRIERHEFDVMNFYIATSRDCDAWDLAWVYAGKPIVPRGGDGAFDKDMVFPSSTVVTHAGRHWLYYMGANERHGTADAKPPVAFDREHAIGLATLRQDGFVCLEAKEQEGTVVTRPFRLQGTRLEVNLSAPNGQAGVEILDARGEPIAGYSGPAATTSQNVDELCWKPTWNAAKDLTALKGRTICLRFRMRNARLFAFRVQ